MTSSTPVSRKPDVPLFAVTLILMGLGVVMVYSSSSVIASEKFASSAFFFKRHLVRFGLALGVMLVLRWIDYHTLLRYGRVFILLGMGLLVFAVVPRLGLSIGEVRGARRAIGLASLSLQPAEAVRLAFVVYLADTLSRRQMEVESFRRFMAPPLVILGVITGLLVAQPDLGTALAIMGVVLAVLVMSGCRVGPLVLCVLGGGVVGGLMAMASAYRWERVRTLWVYLNGRPDLLGAGWRGNQSVVGLGSGGWWGVGLGESRQKFFFLPDPHTDFIFSVIGEELGFAGAAVVLGLFLFFFWRGLRIALHAPDLAGLLLAGGISVSVFLYFVINVAVTTSLIPTTGLAMPFVSYGGSSLLLNAAGVGILLNISQQVHRGAVRPSWLKRRTVWCGGGR